MNTTNGKQKKKSESVVKVVWKDHYSTELKQGWMEQLDLTPCIITSYGHVVAEDDEILLLAQNRDANGTFGNTVGIIKTCIVSRKTL